MRSRKQALLVSGLVLVLVVTGGFFPNPHADPDGSPRAGALPTALKSFDIRVHNRTLLRVVAQGYPTARLESPDAPLRAIQRQEAAQRLQHAVPGTEILFDGLTASAEVVRNPLGLTPALGRLPAVEVALDFLRENASLYGLDKGGATQLESMGESASRSTGLRMVRLRQKIHGLPVFQSDARALVDRDGRLVKIVGRLVPGIGDSLAPLHERVLPATEALRHALDAIGLPAPRTSKISTRSAPSGWSHLLDSADSRFSGPTPSRLTYFPVGEGVVIPAWEQIITFRGGQGWHTVVDARTGTLLYRKDRSLSASAEPARFSVYAQPDGTPLESAAPGSPNSLSPGSGMQFPSASRALVSMHDAYDAVASPDGWIPDRGKTTTGNNVDAFLDVDFDERPDRSLDYNGRPIGNPDSQGRSRDFLGSSPRDFQYLPAPLNGDPNAGDSPLLTPFQRGAVTELFYLTNWFHDRLYGLGFDEAAGNFQTNNFRRGGKQTDPMLAYTQFAAGLGSGTAVLLSSPDGIAGQLFVGVLTGSNPDRDATLDSQFVLHELTHAVTTRIIGDTLGLNYTPGLGMGEGWSDFYALALTHGAPGEDPDAQYPWASYAAYHRRVGPIPAGTFTDNYVYGLRRFPYSTDNAVNPLTWADADDVTMDLSGGIAPSPFNWQRLGASEIHNIGEIWASSLWEVRSRIIAKHGGEVVLGNELALQIVTDALKMTPTDPGFTDARDALLDADCAAFTCAHESPIWEGFADRGLGYGAHTSSRYATHLGVKESFSVPHLDVASARIDDSLGNGNGYLDPGEEVSLIVELHNPWRGLGRSASFVKASLVSPSPGVTVLDGSSDYSDIQPQRTGSGDPFRIHLDPDAVCGDSLSFTLGTTSSLGPAEATFVLRIGRPAGNGAPIIITRTIPGGLAIPDGSLAGVNDSMDVSADLDIADLDFRVDDLTHPFVGDLFVELRAPFGVGADLIIAPGVCQGNTCSQGTNGGANFIMTRIDDSSTNDLLTVGPSAAPFTGDWLPVFNSPGFVQSHPPSSADPVGQLSQYQHQSTRGTWSVHVTDFQGGNAGTLNAWSLIVTPTAYQCTGP